MPTSRRRMLSRTCSLRSPNSWPRPVDWAAAAPMALGLLVGGMIGPSVTRRVPGNVIRMLVGLAGLGLAFKLWIAPS